MFDPGNKLRHLAFFEEVAALEENSDAWREASAGLVTLRLVDAWIEAGVGNAGDDEWNFRSVCAAVDAIGERSQIRSLLTSVLSALRSGKPNIRALVPSLMAFGQALEFDARHALAADVYRALLAHLHPIDDSEASIDAHIRLGVTSRAMNAIEAAEQSFAAAGQIGAAVNDLVGILRGRMGEGSLVRLRGNLPLAAEILDDTIARAVGPELAEVRARAMNERSGIAFQSGQFEFGIRLAYEAYVKVASPSERDRILGNIAGAFAELGVYSAARDAYLILSATAREQYMRWLATLNLIDVASMSGSEMLFEQHRRELVGEKLPPDLATSLQLTLGVGYKRFDQVERAAAHLTSAVAMATEHGFNQYRLDAEAALTALNAPTPRPRVQESPSLDIQEVASAIHNLRATALA